jgi:diadenylate cyclase
VLPAFSWLVRNTLPALLLAIPVIFAPEIRRTLERLGRAGTIMPAGRGTTDSQDAITAVVSAAARLADRRHGALIVMSRSDSLDEYVATGVVLQGMVTPELLLQIFFPNTPLHDGAVIISGTRIVAASCVSALSASWVLAQPQAAYGLASPCCPGYSEVTDAVAVVVSEETGNVSVVHGGRMIRRLDAERLENILRAFYRPMERRKGLLGLFSGLFPRQSGTSREEN